MPPFESLIARAELWVSVGYCILVAGLIGDIIVLVVPEHRRRLEKLLSAFFTIVIIIGVATEHRADSKISGLISEEEDATAVRIKQDDSSIAGLNNRAKTAELQTAKLESIASGRQLTAQEQVEITASLKHFAGRSVFVTSYSGDAEAARLGLQIERALESAGIKVQDNLGRTIAAPGGVGFGVTISGPDFDRDIIAAISETLRNHGKIEVEGKIVVPTMRIGPAVTGIMVALRPLRRVPAR